MTTWVTRQILEGLWKLRIIDLRIKTAHHGCYFRIKSEFGKIEWLKGIIYGILYDRMISWYHKDKIGDFGIANCATKDRDTFITEFFLQTTHSNDIDLFCLWKLDDGGNIYRSGVCRSVDFILFYSMRGTISKRQRKAWPATHNMRLYP